MSKSPQVVYQRLNRLIWLNRLPKAKIMLVENSYLPTCLGVTLPCGEGSAPFARPIIILNAGRFWEKTLLHEMLHIAEPSLLDGRMFDALVERYWNQFKRLTKEPREVPGRMPEPIA